MTIRQLIAGKTGAIKRFNPSPLVVLGKGPHG
jgi:hypothetical protein